MRELDEAVTMYEWRYANGATVIRERDDHPEAEDPPVLMRKLRMFCVRETLFAPNGQRVGV